MTERIYKCQSHLVKRNRIVGGMYNTGTIQPGTPIEWAFFVNAFASGASSWLCASIFYGAFDENNNLIGFIEGSISEWNNRFLIANFVVFDTRFRGKGIGSSLIDQMENGAKERGAGSIYLKTENTNTSAISFHKAKGYSIIGFDQYAYSEKGERMPIYMGKRLQDTF